MIKMSRYDLMNLVIAIANSNILANDANEMIQTGGELNKQVGIALKYLGCETISEVKGELKKYTT
jgi:hypothetical protein